MRTFLTFLYSTVTLVNQTLTETQCSLIYASAMPTLTDCPNMRMRILNRFFYRETKQHFSHVFKYMSVFWSIGQYPSGTVEDRIMNYGSLARMELQQSFCVSMNKRNRVTAALNEKLRHMTCIYRNR